MVFTSINAVFHLLHRSGVDSWRYDLVTPPCHAASMSVSLAEVTALSREVVLQHGGGLDVLAVTTGGDHGRVEVMVDVGGCHREPCRFVVNISRADAKQFDREFRVKLSEALQKHTIQDQ